MRNIVWISAITLCSVYTVSFALYEMKNKRYSSGIFSFFLIFCAVCMAFIKAFI